MQKINIINKLNDKHERFCTEYLIDSNATQAAIRAGYAKKSASVTASRLMNDPAIIRCIQQSRDEITSGIKIDTQWVLQHLADTVEKCLQITPVLESENGRIVHKGTYRFDSNGATKALELIGKHLGMFRDKPVNNVFDLSEFVRNRRDARIHEDAKK